MMKKILSKEDIKRILQRLAHQVLEKNTNPADLVIVGIQTRGIYLAKRLFWIIHITVGQNECQP